MSLPRDLDRIFIMVAIVLTVATIITSCKSKLGSTDSVDLGSAPTQTVKNMSAMQSKNGNYEMRMEAPVMQHFEIDKNDTYDYFPEGISVYGYNEEGLLETEILANEAKHTLSENDEKWSAFGNVLITNFINGERMETDTIYWDHNKQKIFTDCYVKLYSPKGLMQGYGMESDEMARNAVLLNPFDSFTIVEQDSTSVSYIDTVNFIGPLYKR